MLHMERVVDVLIWSTGTILPLPRVTSRPPGAKFSVVGCPVASWIGVTHRDSSDTYRRIGLDSEILTRASWVRRSGALPRGGERDLRCGSPLDTGSYLPRPNRDITPHLTLFTMIFGPGAAARAEPALAANALREYCVTTDRRSHQGRKPGTVIPVRKLGSAESPEGGSTAILCVSQAALGQAGR
jgi:hypothetical protein